MLRRTSRSYCVYTALNIRFVYGVFYGVSFVLLLFCGEVFSRHSLRYRDVSSAFARRFHGVHCARVELLPRPMAFYDKNTKNRCLKNMQILEICQKQTKYYLNEMHIYVHIRISFTMSIEQQAGLLLVYMQAQQI